MGQHSRSRQGDKRDKRVVNIAVKPEGVAFTLDANCRERIPLSQPTQVTSQEQCLGLIQVEFAAHLLIMATCKAQRIPRASGSANPRVRARTHAQSGLRTSELAIGGAMRPRGLRTQSLNLVRLVALEVAFKPEPL